MVRTWAPVYLCYSQLAVFIVMFQNGCSSSGHHVCIPVIWNKEGMEKDIFLLYL